MSGRLSETPRWAGGMSEAQVGAIRGWKWDGGMSPEEPEESHGQKRSASRERPQQSPAGAH